MKDFHPTIHELKTWPEQYEKLRDGRKRFELRKNDRDFQRKDLLILREYDAATQVYTGYVTVAVVTCVVRGEWLAPGYVALGIAVMEAQS